MNDKAVIDTPMTDMQRATLSIRLTQLLRDFPIQALHVLAGGEYWKHNIEALAPPLIQAAPKPEPKPEKPKTKRRRSIDEVGKLTALTIPWLELLSTASDTDTTLFLRESDFDGMDLTRIASSISSAVSTLVGPGHIQTRVLFDNGPLLRIRLEPGKQAILKLGLEFRRLKKCGEIPMHAKLTEMQYWVERTKEMDNKINMK